jgi:hypothetical protein
MIPGPSVTDNGCMVLYTGSPTVRPSIRVKDFYFSEKVKGYVYYIIGCFKIKWNVKPVRDKIFLSLCL